MVVRPVNNVLSTVMQATLVLVNAKLAHLVLKSMTYRPLVYDVTSVRSQLMEEHVKLVQQEHTAQMLVLLSVNHVLVVILLLKVHQLAYHVWLDHSQLRVQLVKLVHSTLTQLWLVHVNV